ncbi:S1 RNA-binding domain-containing protein [Ruminococcus albus]|uniref:S1 RNA binding domain-containing protein n=1 Tax=Ruminococcus albus TaxID=1264 RepID=A0A1I1MM76_RUMAL|nr:S1 RNA-binding domain-containing protein [Ruminococcus albus]SFC86614.1 S1 RNA binding domain-containing protein [Ruminococcus albus]
MTKYFPEGRMFNSPENKFYLQSAENMAEAMTRGLILEGHAVMCTTEHDLVVELPFGKGIIPRTEGALGIADGTTRDIALLSRVNKTVCFKVIDIVTDENGVTAVLSRRAAQEECLENYISKLQCGDVIPAKITHLEPFGAFVDIGCGIPSLIPIDAISVSRISHPNDRFFNGQDIYAAVKNISGDRICLTHKELLGTWQQNAQMFSAGETVGGVIRSVEDYGIFIELAPNLAGLAEPKDGVTAGQAASVYIKALIPEKMKVKLIIVDVFENLCFPSKINYFINSGHLKKWEYSTKESGRKLVSVF